MMNDIKKNELNEQEMDNVAGGAFWTASPALQGEGIALKNAVNAASDAAGIVGRPAISFLRTDSMR